MPEFRITSSKVHPGSKMKEGLWHFLRGKGSLPRLLHKYGSTIYEWTADHDRHIDAPIVMTAFIDKNQRNADINIHGDLLEIDNAASVGPATPANDFTTSAKGIGKLFIALNAGTDLAGTITITGTSVDRDTQAQTGADSETIAIAGLTTDGSDTDGGGHVRHSYTDGYISDKWWVGALVISSSTVNISDMDIFHVSFEQFNDRPSLTLRTFDINTFPTNAAAALYAHLYLVQPTGSSRCDIVREASIVLTSPTANQYYRLRQGKIACNFNGEKSGVFLDVYFDPSPQTYFSDTTIKVWGTERVKVADG